MNLTSRLRFLSDWGFFPSFPQLRGLSKVWVLAAALAAASIAVFAGVIVGLPTLEPGGGYLVPWWLIAGMSACVEIFVVHLRFRRDEHSFSLSEIPLVLGLFFVPPPLLVVGILGGTVAALVFYRKQPLIKVVFNAANLVFSTTVGIVLFRLILGHNDPLGPAGWIGAFTVAIVTDLLTLFMIVMAITLSLGKPPELRKLFTTGGAAAFFNTSLALVAVTVIARHPTAAWLLVILAALLFVAYRSYGSLTTKHEGIELLYESTKVVQQSLQVDAVILTLLAQAREMFRAERAEIVLFGEDGKTATRTRIGPGDEQEVMQPITLDPTEGVWARVASEGRAVFIPRPISNERLRRHFGDQGIRDALVAPLHGDKTVVGTLMVANRLGGVSTFVSEHVQLFETLANHASVSLQNSRLVHRLRRQAAENEYQALHDPLTGLANRTLFREKVDEAVRASLRSHAAVSVMMMDLDRFKEINDTLGHHNGDLLLGEIAGRLTATLGPGHTIARLSGDEFAILVPPGTGTADTIETAALILRALEQPFMLQELKLEVAASIGIAICPDHGTDVDTLIQRADVAMYLAKEAHSGYEIYDAERDQYSPARLALVAELRRGIEQGELVVLYQPKASLRSERIIGAEALVRWNHPRRGFLPPDEFIPIAEQTGLLRPLTIYVLDTALRQCRAWRDAGHDMTVAVNLSVRNLLDLGLSDEIGRMLDAYGVPASALELEITESTLMADPARAEAVLTKLNAMGIGIAIDDFGTGYSSLSYIKRLPVDEIKIDRSFVMTMATDETHSVIVHSTIELGRNLGLRVVAEGVESREVWEKLRELGCDVAQGYYLSRPVTAQQLTERLRDPRALPAEAHVTPTRPDGSARTTPVRSKRAPRPTHLHALSRPHSGPSKASGTDRQPRTA